MSIDVETSLEETNILLVFIEDHILSLVSRLLLSLKLVPQQTIKLHCSHASHSS